MAVLIGPEAVRASDPSERPRPMPAFSYSLLVILCGQAACGAIVLFGEILYARLLGPTARGTVSLCLMSVAFANLLGGLGGEGTIVYWASRSRNSNSSWLAAILASGSLGCAVVSALWILAYWRFHLPFLRGISEPSAKLVLCTFPVAILFAYTMGLATGSEQFRVRSASATLRQLAGILCFLFIFPFVGPDASAALWGNLAGLSIGMLAALVLLRHTVGGFWKVDGVLKDVKPTLTYGLRGQVGNLAAFFNYRLDVFIVNYFLDPAQLGLYALGVVISESLWQIPQAAGLALCPRTARTTERDAAQFTCFVLRQVLFISSLSGLGIAALSPLLVPLVFGARFQAAVPVIWWIVPGTVALCLGKVGSSDLAGRGKNGYASVFAFVCFAMTALLDWYLIPRLGIRGAALASSLAYLADAVLILAALHFELKVRWRELLWPTRRDFEAYRLLWLRLKAALPTAPTDPTLLEIVLSAERER